MHSGAVGHEWPVAASERPLSIAESCSRSGRSSGCAVGSAFGAQLGCDASSTQLTSIVGVMDASLQPPRPRSASESSIDSGVTACEGTDLLHHARQLRRMADERIASARDNRCRPSTESAPADIASTSPPSYLRTRKLNLDLPESSRQQQSIDSSSHRPHRPRSQSTGTPMRHTATMTPRDNVILLAKKDSAMPDLSPAAAQHRSMRRRKQAVDEAFIWIRKQLDTIEWQHQDMICMLLRNIKELRDYKQTMVAASGADTSLLHPGRLGTAADSNFQRQPGSVYRPRRQSTSTSWSPKHSGSVSTHGQTPGNGKVRFKEI